MKKNNKYMKICIKCKTEKDLSEFSKHKNTKDGLQHQCKECANEYHKKWYEKNSNHKKDYDKKRYENNPEYWEKRYENNPEYMKEQSKKWYEDNKEHKKEKNKKWYEDNPEYYKEYHNSKANYNTYAPQISYVEKVRNVDGFLQVKCTYCGKWYFPTNLSIQSRIQALNGKQKSDGAECRLYCSTECKIACPIYHKIKFQEGHPLKNDNSSREVQPELRQMVFKRDGYTCLKCGKHQNDLDVPLHCHHIEGIRWNPIESADVDQCMTVCKDCHKEIHKQEDCGYNDLQCK